MTVVVVFGTRPEAIKLAPVIAAMRQRRDIEVRVAVTAQHRELLEQMLQVFDLVPDVDLDLMQPNQTLAGLGSRILVGVEQLLKAQTPDLMVVQGDTSSAFLSALSAFYQGVPVAHVEAGLRTDSPQNPFPEEMNRRLVSQLALLHFAPTEGARKALVAEGIESRRVFVTGNTVVDALQQVRRSSAYRQTRLPVAVLPDQKLILVTLHRRESWSVLGEICRALKAIATQRTNTRIVIPVHPNPAVRDVITAELGAVNGVTLIDPVDYFSFLKLLEASALVLTDSGGVQEEAPILGRPVLVLRDNTERPEAVALGVSRVVGTNADTIVAAALALIDDDAHYASMAKTVSPFGDGHAAARIAEIIATHHDEIETYARSGGNPRARSAGRASA